MKRDSEKNYVSSQRIYPSTYTRESLVLISLMCISWENIPADWSLSLCPVSLKQNSCYLWVYVDLQVWSTTAVLTMVGAKEVFYIPHSQHIFPLFYPASYYLDLMILKSVESVPLSIFMFTECTKKGIKTDCKESHHHLQNSVQHISL